MKKKWIQITALCSCAVLFLGYRVYRQIGIDNDPPVITIADGEGVLHTVSMSDLEAGLLQGVTAQDAHDGDVTGSILIEQIGGVTADHRAQVTYAAFDKANNVAKVQRTVQLTDYTPPRFTLNAPLNFVYGTTFDPLKYVGAQDMIDGDISHRVKATLMDESVISAEGTHDVLFRVTNSLGDTAQLVLPVEVYYNDRYSAQLSLTDYLIYLPVNAPFDPEDYLDEYLLLGQTTDLTGRIPSELTLTVTGQVDTKTPGAYSVGYTVSTVRAEHTYYGYSRLIVVVEG